MNARTAKDLRKAALPLQRRITHGKDGAIAHLPHRDLKHLWHAVPWTQRQKLRVALAQGLLSAPGLGDEARRLLRAASA